MCKMCRKIRSLVVIFADWFIPCVSNSPTGLPFMCLFSRLDYLLSGSPIGISFMYLFCQMGDPLSSPSIALSLICLSFESDILFKHFKTLKGSLIQHGNTKRANFRGVPLFKRKNKLNGQTLKGIHPLLVVACCAEHTVTIETGLVYFLLFFSLHLLLFNCCFVT